MCRIEDSIEPSDPTKPIGDGGEGKKCVLYRSHGSTNGPFLLRSPSSFCCHGNVFVRQSAPVPYFTLVATKVGDRLKNPETPIWVVCSESHYSVLFGVDRAIVHPPQPTTATREDSRRQLAGGSGGATAKSAPAAGSSGRGNGGSAASGHGSGGRETDGAEAFDLEYYDGLGRQDEV